MLAVERFTWCGCRRRARVRVLAAYKDLLTLWKDADHRVCNSWVSGAGELHPRALAEPYMNLSAHTAPIAEPRCAPSCQ